MQNIKELTEDPLFKNWVVAIRALQITKEGLIPFVKENIEEFQRESLECIQREILNGLEAKCNQCTAQTLLPCPTPGMCDYHGDCRYHGLGKRKACPQNGLCDEFLKKMKTNSGLGVCLKYTDARKWSDNWWEVAKCYCPPKGCSVMKAEDDTDVGVFLFIIQNHQRFQRFQDSLQAKCEELLCKAYALLHRAKFEMTEEQLKSTLDAMEAVLKCTKHEIAESAVTQLQNIARPFIKSTDLKQIEEKSVSSKEIDPHVEIEDSPPNSKTNDKGFMQTTDLYEMEDKLVPATEGNTVPEEVSQMPEIEGCAVMSTRFRSAGSKISWDPDTPVGKGGNSSVFEGRFGEGKMKVAVKRIQFDNESTASETNKNVKHLYREVHTLANLEPERNANIVGFYASTTINKTLYIAFQYCHGTLTDYVKNEKIWAEDMKPVNVNKCLANGLSFLEKHKIVHRDLKPSNVFYLLESDKISRIVIGDFGLAKMTQGNKRYSVSREQCGTWGFMAPEAWIAGINETLHAKSDIFSLGILFFFTTTLGKHPFGLDFSNFGYKCQEEIRKGKPTNFEELPKQRDCLKDLLQDMLSTDHTSRPSAEVVSAHPALWTDESILKYFTETSDEFEKRIKNGKSKDTEFENPDSISVEDWIIPKEGWIEGMTALEKYETQKHFVTYKQEHTPRPFFEGKDKLVRALMRAIRNTNIHLEHDYPQAVKDEIGKDLAGFWLTLCPKLLMHVYKIRNKW